MNAIIDVLSLASLNWPLGLFWFEAIFASFAFAAIPADTVILAFA